MNFTTAFITGLTTGGLTCLAVQGGLLIALLAKQQSPDQPTSSWQRLLLPVSGFLIAKIFVYTVFGLLLGAVGSRLQFSSTAQAWVQGIAALLMIVTGIRLIWPQWLPWLAFNPPASVRRLVRRSAKTELISGPVLLGLLTILIPCGSTIAMEAAALATGSPITAARILFGFTLGTVPLFFIIGVLAKEASVWQRRLQFVTAALVVGIGVYSLNATFTLLDSPLAWKNIVATRPSNNGQTIVPTDHPSIRVSAYGYEPSAVTVPAGQTVNIDFQAEQQLGCTSVIVIPKLSIQTELTPGATKTVRAFFPSPGTYTFTCGMGMYSGTIIAT